MGPNLGSHGHSGNAGKFQERDGRGFLEQIAASSSAMRILLPFFGNQLHGLFQALGGDGINFLGQATLNLIPPPAMGVLSSFINKGKGK